jgi:hypothetical protein
MLVDHSPGYFFTLDRCARRHDNRLIVVGWSLQGSGVFPTYPVMSGMWF